MTQTYAKGDAPRVTLADIEAEIGRKVARDNAIAQMWKLMGFRLQCRLAEERPA